MRRAWTVGLALVALGTAPGCPHASRPSLPAESRPAAQAAPQAETGSSFVKGTKLPPQGDIGAAKPTKGGLEPTPGTVTIERRRDGARWTMTDPNGRHTTTTTTASVSEADLGVKLYPGAVVVSGGKTSTAGGGSWAVAELVTRDPYEKVALFYRQAYETGNQVIPGPGSLMIIIGTSPKETKTLSVTRDSATGETRIAITSGSY
jgi:hypothetical protein